MTIRSIFFIASLAVVASPMTAQQDEAVKSGSVASFYQAYFLDKDKPKDKAATAKAIGLYAAFVAQNKSHKLAGRAAANCLTLIYSTGDVKKADAFAKTHSALITAEEDRNPTANDPMRGFGFGRRGGGQGQSNPNQDTIDKLMDLHGSAEEPKKGRLGAAVTRLGGARALMMARFGGGRGRGGFGGRTRNRGLTKPKITEMKPEEAKAAVEKMVSAAEAMIDRMAAAGQADKADKLEEKLDKIEDLVDEGKLVEAQKLIDSIEAGNTGRGRGRQGRGNQGRRGRGGDAGGRRRRGGRDTEEGDGKEKKGEGEGEGGRRRRRR